MPGFENLYKISSNLNILMDRAHYKSSRLQAPIIYRNIQIGLLFERQT